MDLLRPRVGWLAPLVVAGLCRGAPCEGQTLRLAPASTAAIAAAGADRWQRGSPGATDLAGSAWLVETRAPFARTAPGRLPARVWPDLARHPAGPPLLSLALPGLGQRALGQRRGWAYLALEAVGWAMYLDRRGAGSRYRDRYRDFAWEEARLGAAVRVDGDFDYYETLSKWTRSGAYDTDEAASGIQPESDPTAFNGSIWALAEGLFLSGGPAVPESDPRYQAALAYYRERAYGPRFLWDWTGTGAAQQEFSDLIGASDDRFRQATNALGVVLANHLVSAVDAYLSSRGRGRALEAGVAPPVGLGSGWSAWLRLPSPR